MKLIGLTGGSGSGKTTAACCFSECGAAIIDADAVARKVVMPGSLVLEKITETFGSEYILSDGTLNRAALGRLVFSDEKSLKQLNEIMIPAISSEITEQIEAYNRSGAEVVVLDAPLLFDYGLDALCDVVVLMNTPLSVRINRLMKRDGLTEVDIRKRISSQIDFDSFSNRAQYFLDATDKETLEEAVQYIYNCVKEENGCE